MHEVAQTHHLHHLQKHAHLQYTDIGLVVLTASGVAFYVVVIIVVHLQMILNTSLLSQCLLKYLIVHTIHVCIYK